MGKIITVNIQKGGCAKTTTVHELASQLTKMGKKCLTVDLDQQGNLSRCSGAELTGYCTVFEMLDRKCDTEDSIQNMYYDIIPSSKQLKNAEIIFSDANKIGNMVYLKEGLDKIKDQYDFILIDTPPSLGKMSQMALVASDYVIVPIEASASSLQGLGQLYEAIEEIKKYYNKDLKVLGLLLTRFTERTVFNRMIREQLEDIALQMNTSVFKTYIRDSIAVKESQSMKKSLIEYAPNSNPARDYKALAKEMIKKLEL